MGRAVIGAHSGSSARSTTRPDTAPAAPGYAKRVGRHAPAPVHELALLPDGGITGRGQQRILLPQGDMSAAARLSTIRAGRGTAGFEKAQMALRTARRLLGRAGRGRGACATSADVRRMSAGTIRSPAGPPLNGLIRRKHILFRQGQPAAPNARSRCAAIVAAVGVDADVTQHMAAERVEPKLAALRQTARAGRGELSASEVRRPRDGHFAGCTDEPQRCRFANGSDGHGEIIPFCILLPDPVRTTAPQQLPDG